MSIEAMKQALDCLQAAYNLQQIDDLIPPHAPVKQAITSLRQAIEQAEKQVVFKIYKPTLPRGAIPNVRDAELPWVYDQDPSSGNVASMWVTPVKATPQPQREWAGLTFEEILETYRGPDGSDYVDYARAIGAKLKEKNT